MSSSKDDLPDEVTEDEKAQFAKELGDSLNGKPMRKRKKGERPLPIEAILTADQLATLAEEGYSTMQLDHVVPSHAQAIIPAKVMVNVPIKHRQGYFANIDNELRVAAVMKLGHRAFQHMHETRENGDVVRTVQVAVIYVPPEGEQKH